jgi:hypothetical protein
MTLRVKLLICTGQNKQRFQVILFSSSVSLSTKATANNIASNLTTNNLTIKTTKEDINITGSNIDAQQLWRCR